jgi:hypothetical protein
MKKLILIFALLYFVYPMKSQVSAEEKLLGYEKDAKSQANTITATMTSASRLFKSPEDLTSVIIVIPKGSQVTVLESDSTYLKVSFEENVGYIYRKHAEIDKSTVPVTEPVKNQTTVVQENQSNQPQQDVSRFSYLESKYGTSLAARINSGKIWKGMNSEMVKDSWGRPDKINREISGNNIKEEWIYKSTWLYMENNTLVDWGPVRN